jgi:hypothetical protein
MAIPAASSLARLILWPDESRSDTVERSVALRVNVRWIFSATMFFPIVITTTTFLLLSPWNFRENTTPYRKVGFFYDFLERNYAVRPKAGLEITFLAVEY